MKSYFASSVPVAMEQARQELGGDAVLVTSRAASAEARHLGAYEVVFASDLPVEAPAPAALPAVPVPAAAAGTAEPLRAARLETVLKELQALRQQFHAWRGTMQRTGERPAWVAAHPELAEPYAALVAAEVDRDLVQQVLAKVLERMGERPAEPAPHKLGTARPRPALERRAVGAALRAELERTFTVDSSLGMEKAGPRLVALVGPPGAGKTAMVAKLAVRYGLTGKRPLQLLSLDTLRVGASEQLRCYAGLLGVGFQTVETNRGLGQAIEEHSGKDLILIDTPGLTAQELEGGHDTPEYLAQRTDIQKHLVLPASMRFADMARVSQAYDCFRPSRLIFTRLDETETYGPVLCEAASTNRPISFFGVGQRVPEDFEPAERAGLLDRLLANLSTGAAGRNAA